MNKIQYGFFFNSVTDFYNFLSDKDLSIVIYLEKIIKNTIPGIKIKLNYNVPFYYKNKNICFIWPSCIPWGGNKKNDGSILFGFCKGFLLKDENSYLDKGNRKQVYTKTFYSIEEIEELTLKQLIFEANLVDDNFKK